ncbi:MAG: hypothetical protein WCR85_02640 [Sphaerochaeta sp.]|nr:hypothetical protein [Sphaerochaeta sp.]
MKENHTFVLLGRMKITESSIEHQKASGRENHWPKGVALLGNKSRTKM